METNVNQDPIQDLNQVLPPTINLLEKDQTNYTNTEESLVSIANESNAQYPKKYVSMASTSMNLLNSLLGAGLLTISNSFCLGGFVPLFTLLTLIAFLSFVSSTMVVNLQTRLGAHSFEEMASKILGKFGSFGLTICSAFFCYSCLVAYAIIGLQIVENWLSFAHIEIYGWRYKVLALCYTISFPFPLTFIKNMKFLSFFSAFSVCCLLVYVFVMIVLGIIDLPKTGISPTVILADLRFELFQGLAMYSLTFALALVQIPILQPMDPSPAKRTMVLGATFIMCYLFVSIPGAIGYFMFGADSKSDIMQSFDQTNPIIIFVRSAFFFVVNASFPVISFTIANNWSRVIFKVQDSKTLPFKKRFVCLGLVIIIPLVIAMFLPSIRPVIAIGGAFGGCMGNFIFPPLIWIVLSGKKWYKPSNLACIGLIIFGALSTVISTYQSVVDAIHDIKNNK